MMLKRSKRDKILPKYQAISIKNSNCLSYFSGMFHVKGKRGRNITDIMMKWNTAWHVWPFLRFIRFRHDWAIRITLQCLDLRKLWIDWKKALIPAWECEFFIESHLNSCKPKQFYEIKSNPKFELWISLYLLFCFSTRNFEG